MLCRVYKQAHAEVLIMTALLAKLESVSGDVMVKPMELLAAVFGLFLIDRQPGPLLEVLQLWSAPRGTSAVVRSSRYFSCGPLLRVLQL